MIRPYRDCAVRRGAAALASAVSGALLLLVAPPVFAQQATLASLQAAAVAADPRTRELALLEQQSMLRLRNVAALRWPAVGIDAQTQAQSDAAEAPVLAPNGRPIFSAPRTAHDASVRVEQRLFDPAVPAQGAFERAQLAEQQARVRASVYPIRQQVNDAYFAAAALQQRAGVLAATIVELEGRLREANLRVEQGTSLPAEAAAVEATLLQRQQDEGELRAGIRAAVARLATIVGAPVTADVLTPLPDLAAAAGSARQRLPVLRARPEYEQFARTRERIARQSDLGSSQAQPRLSAFARAGYGRPGLDFITNQWQTYGIGGVRLQWNAFDWGATGREREAQSLQSEIVSQEEAAFSRSLAAAIEGDLATADHLERALAMDRRIIELRSEVERAARLRLQEGVVDASDYLARNTELLQARFAQASHEVELAQARARLLTTLGLEAQ